MTSYFSANSFVENSRLSSALDMAGFGCWEISLLDQKFWLNELCKSHFGYLGSNILSFELMIDLVHKDDRKNVRTALEEALTRNSVGKFDIEIRTNSGYLNRPRWLNWKGEVSYSDNGSPVHFSGIVQNITKLVETTTLLNRKQNLISSICENTAACTSRWDSDLNMIWSNNAYHEKLTTVTNSTSSNKVEIKKRRNRDFEPYLQKVIDTKNVQHCEPTSSSDGSHLHATFLPELGIDAQVESILVIEHSRALEISPSLEDEEENSRFSKLEELNIELAVVNEEYIAANNELEKTNKLLSISNENLKQFAYIASHDLQEPLRKIRSFGDLLRREIPENSDALSYISRMQDGARRMSLLIDDLLTFSQFSSKPIEFTKVDLNEIVAKVLSDLETSVDQAQATITIPSLPSINGDDRQLSQLFQNLLSNAIKFRRQDVLPEIQISWSIVKAPAIEKLSTENTLAKAYDRIDISDNGIGFDKRHADRIFKVFQRLHGRSEYEGTGIGLAICEKVVSNHNGMISVESQLAIGTTFSVYFPIY